MKMGVFAPQMVVVSSGRLSIHFAISDGSSMFSKMLYIPYIYIHIIYVYTYIHTRGAGERQLKEKWKAFISEMVTFWGISSPMSNASRNSQHML